MIHENIELTGSFIVSGSFVLPNHSGTGSVTALTGSTYHDTIDNVLKVYTGNSWVTVGEQTEPTPAAASADIEYLLVAGGGGGSQYTGAGGGGAGGYLSSSLASVTSGSSFTVTVGAGGAGGVNTNESIAGTDSSIAGDTISTITSIGGGKGGGYKGSFYSATGGGSGGGGAYAVTTAAGSGTVGQGNDGGIGGGGSGDCGGGGGGAGAAGAPGSGTRNGGDGKQSGITGTVTYYAGGGGGSQYPSGTNSSGGQGGGGTGGLNGSGFTSGTTNSGGGGGGTGQGGTSTQGGSGGSGVAILAYPTASISATGGVRTFFNDRVAHIFNSSGTFSVGGTKTYTHNTLDVFGDSSCIALYTLDGNANDTGGSYNGTASNVTYAQSYINNGGVFNGSSSTISLPVSNYLQSTGNKSYSLWFKTSVTSGNHSLFDDYGTGTGGINHHHYVQGDTGQLQFVTYRPSPTANVGITSGLSLNDGNWHHIVVVSDNSNSQILVYIDNNIEITLTGLPAFSQGKTTGYLGSYNSAGNGYSWDGQMDQLRIFNKALSASEVTTLYTE